MVKLPTTDAMFKKMYNKNMFFELNDLLLSILVSENTELKEYKEREESMMEEQQPVPEDRIEKAMDDLIKML